MRYRCRNESSLTVMLTQLVIASALALVPSQVYAANNGLAVTPVRCLLGTVASLRSPS